MLKYAVKPSDLTASPAWLAGITAATKNVRYLSTGGTLKDCIREEVNSDDMLDTDTAERDEQGEKELGRLIFKYWPTAKRYARKTGATA